MGTALLLISFTICLLLFTCVRRFPGNRLTRSVVRKATGCLSVVLVTALLFATPTHATTITEYGIPGNPGVWDLAVNATANLVFFTESAGNKIGILNYGSPNPSLREIPVPTINSQPWGITTVPWPNVAAVFTEAYANKIGVVSRNCTNVLEYSINTTGGGSPRKIIWDSRQGRNCTWFSEYGGRIGRFNLSASGWAASFAEYTLPSSPASAPIGIAVDTIGVYVWYADFGRQSIGRLNPDTRLVREYSVAPFSPWDVAVDADGIVWFSGQQVGTDINIIGRLNPEPYELNRDQLLVGPRWALDIFRIPTPNCEVHEIELDPAGNVWFTEHADNIGKVGRFVPLVNSFVEYPIITPNAKPQGLAVPPAKDVGGAINVWFAEYGGRRIARLRQPEGPVVLTTVSSLSSVVSTSSTVTSTFSWTATPPPPTATIAITTSGTTVPSTFAAVSTTSSTIADTISTVLTSSTYWVVTYTYTTSTSLTTTTATHTQSIVSGQTTSTTTSTTVIVVSTSWESVTVLTTSTAVSVSSFSETRSTTLTSTQTSTIFSPTVTVPTTTVTGVSATIYSPTVTKTSTALIETSTTTTSSTTTTAIVYSPTVTVTSTSTTLTTALPLGALRPCVIASAAYGSELAGSVQFLREFRNEEVLSTFAGSQFMKAFNMFYYSFSPAVASMILQSPVLAQFVRALVYPLIGSLEASSSIFRMLMFAPELGIVLAGIFGSVVLGIVYLTPAVIAIRFLSRRIRLKRCGLQANSGMMGSKAR